MNYIDLTKFEQQIVCSGKNKSPQQTNAFPDGNRQIIATLDYEQTIGYFEAIAENGEDLSDPEVVEASLIYRFTDSRGATVYYWPGGKGLFWGDANPCCACGGGWATSVDDWGDVTEEEIENHLSMGHGGDWCESVKSPGAVSQYCRERTVVETE